MPTSEKKTITNRQNAQKSTGPKTEEGKKISCRNAVKHAVNSAKIVINSSPTPQKAQKIKMLNITKRTQIIRYIKK